MKISATNTSTCTFALSLILLLLLAMPPLTMSFQRTVAAMYQPYRMHSELFNEENFKHKWLQWLHPDFLEIHEAVQAAPETAKPEEISSKLKVEMPEVYSFNVFAPEFLEIFNDEVKNFYSSSEKYGIPTRRPNSMNKYGVIVNEIGMRPLLTSFQQEYLWPVAKKLFPKQASQFDDHHSFIVRYQAEEDLGLDMHTDDSDVTFNVCMGEEFTGSTLSFCGMFGSPDHRKFSLVYHPEVGRAILHLGTRRHGADDIESGRRTNLIVWNHNWAWRASTEHKARRIYYQPEEGPPDDVCLSYTHDVDYPAYKDLPESVMRHPETYRPWCPPKGKEYEGYDEQMIYAAKRKAKKLDIQKQDEL